MASPQLAVIGSVELKQPEGPMFTWTEALLFTLLMSTWLWIAWLIQSQQR